MKLQYTTEDAFALDISDRALRIAHLSRRGKKRVLQSYGELSLPKGVIDHGEIIKQDIVEKSLANLLAHPVGKPLKTNNVIAVLPESKTFIKVIDIDNPSSATREAIEEEAAKHIPLLPDEMYLDWEPISSGKILIGAAPKAIVDQYVNLLEQANLVPIVFEVEAAAIARSIFSTIPTQHAVIVIDFGAARTGLFVYDRGNVQFTVSLPIAGTSITASVAKTLSLSVEEAEKAKMICGMDPDRCDGALLKILSQPIKKIAQGIAGAIEYYEQHFSDTQPVKQIILCGGGARFRKITEVLSDELKLNTTIADPASNIIMSNKCRIPQNKILSYTTAIGLAVRGLDEY